MARTRRSEIEMSAEYDLKYWGYHVGKQFAADGYPSDNPILALLSGHSDLNPLSPRFGVNTKDIPGRAWAINAVIMSMRGELRAVLVARYCLPVVYETGRPFEPETIAEALALHVRTYYRRLREAREKYLHLAAGNRVINGQGVPAEKMA